MRPTRQVKDRFVSSLSVPADYLFVTHTLETGGIETLVVRMANALAQLGLRTVVAGPDGPMAQWLAPSVERIALERIEDFRPSVPGQPVNIWCSLPTLMVDLWPFQKRIWSRYGSPSRCTSGIFHPDQWYHDGRHSLSYLQGRVIQRLAEPGSIYFMNEASLDAHVPRWGGHLRDYPVFRLHLDAGAMASWSPPGTARLSLVSVGRIVGFKNYNYDAAAIMTDLHRRGIDIDWTVYGDGPDRSALMEGAARLDLPGRLTFAGEVDYGDLVRTINRHDLFVGMGTAALEAALSGQPTILALSNVARGCYGFLDEAPSDSVAELVEGYPPVDLADTIERYAGMTDEGRVEVGRHGRASAIARGGGEEPPFEEMFAAGRPFPAKRSSRFRADLLESLSRLRRIGRRR